MRHLKLLLILLSLAACSKPSKTPPTVLFLDKASVFTSNQTPAYAGDHVIETSLVDNNGEIKTYFDLGAKGNFSAADLGANGDTFTQAHSITSNRRFSYVMKYQNTTYAFYESNGDIFVDSSLDGEHFSTLNSGQPVVSHETNGIFHILWNVGVDVDDQGVWHMFIECSDDEHKGQDVGLCYASSQDGINFVKSPTIAIEHAGNPFVKNIPSKGLLIIHGATFANQGIFGWEWYITATTMDLQGTLTTHSDFTIGTPSVHICDPHAVDLPNGQGSMLTFSVDQDYSYIAHSQLNLEQIFDSLN